MAKRNCRRTEEEAAIHEKAVKMRKMTDEQLVHYVEDRVGKERGKGACGMGDHDIMIRNFIQAIGLLPGVGKTTMEKIRGLAEEGGWIGRCERAESEVWDGQGGFVQGEEG